MFFKVLYSFDVVILCRLPKENQANIVEKVEKNGKKYETSIKETVLL